MVQGRGDARPPPEFVEVIRLNLPSLGAPPSGTIQVPAMRMALDFVVYLGVVTLFNVVVGQEDNGALTNVEIAFTIYIAVRTMYFAITTTTVSRCALCTVRCYAVILCACFCIRSSVQ